jgi:hypothetical protein
VLLICQGHACYVITYPHGCRFPNPIPYPVDDDNVLLGGWVNGFHEAPDHPAPNQTVSGKQRYMLALPFMWDQSCTAGMCGCVRGDV